MKRRALAPALLTSVLIAACGGGGSDPNGSGAATATTTVNGVASKGPLKQALVTAYKVKDDGTRGDVITSKETDDTGAYTLDLGSYSGPVQLEVTVVAGKTKMADEATGADQTLPDDFKLRSALVVTAPTSGSTQIQSASITPYTELATKIAEDSGGLSQANIANATKVVFDLIGVDPVTTKPIDYSKTAPADATEDQKKYALLNAAVSTLAATTPTTTDATTLKCFDDAGSDAGKKIKCATDQIAKAVTVDKTGSTTLAAVNKNFVGLGDALVAASNDDKNKTGRTVSTDDADSKRLKELETEVRNSTTGTAPPVKLDLPVQDQADVAKAKLFFSRMRSNLASLQSAPLDTGLADGMRAFEASLRTEAATVASDTAQLLRLAQIGLVLWQDYKSGATTDPNSVSVPGLPGGCTVFSGNFPTLPGGSDNQVGADGTPGAPYANTAVTATSAEDASWVACSLNQGVLPTAQNGVVQYRRSILMDTSASATLATIPYTAITRSRSYDSGSAALVQRNLTPALSGSFGGTLTEGQVTGLQFVGDLPPGVTAAGVLLAARYPVNLNAALTTLTSGASRVAFTSGSLGVVPVGASAASLTVDLSADGDTAVVLPGTVGVKSDTAPTDAQLADASITVAARIGTAKGTLKGRLVADRFSDDSIAGLQPNRVVFNGIISAAGSSGTVAEVLNGTLEGSRSAASKMVAFSGTLTLPGRPVMTLSLSVTETPAADSNPRTVAMTGRYVQDAITLQATGSETGTGSARTKALTMADSSGVTVSLASASASATVTVSGRSAASIDNARGRITYADGSFESLN